MEGDGAAEVDAATSEAPDAKVPVKALQAERAKRQAAEKALADLQAAQTKAEAERAAAAAKAEEEAAKQRGEYEKLYGDTLPKLTAAQERLAEYEAKEAARLERLTTRNTERVAALPENLRSIVPGLDPEALADWLDRAAPVLTADDTRPAGTRGKPPGAKAEMVWPPEAFAAARQQGKGDGNPDEQKRWIQTAWANTARGKAWLNEQAKRGGS